MTANRFLVKARRRMRLIARYPAVAVVVRAIDRMMAREVMLFAGGTGFFGLLALAPAVLVAVSIYGLIFSADDALNQFTRLEMTDILPPNVHDFLNRQISELAGASNVSLTLQGGAALLIAWFAAARGAKAMIAGLNQIARRAISGHLPLQSDRHDGRRRRRRAVGGG